MHKYWVVLKVSLTRPWVWLMLFFGLFQVFPLAMFWSQDKLRETKVAIPAFDVPDVVVSQTQEIQELARQNRLGTIEGLNTRDLHGEVLFESNGQPRASAEMLAQPRQADQMGGWPLLEQMPQLQSLEMVPPNGLNAAGWKRIGQLIHLENLTLQNIGAVDGEALKTGGADLQSAFGHLTNLRQLNVNNAGTLDWKLPPLPKLEYVVLGYNLQLESTLETLAQYSPNLHTIALFGYQDGGISERMLAATRKMPRLRRVYIVNSTTAKSLDDTSQQVEFLRTRLPGIAVHRGTFSIGRLGVCAFLLCQAMFISFLVWFQSGLTLSQPLAAVMPGHRRPHLFWPLMASLFAMVVFVSGATYMGVFFPVALAIGCMAAMLVATILPGHDSA